MVDHYLGEFDFRGENIRVFRWLKMPPKEISGSYFETMALKHGVQVYAADRFVVGNSVPEKAIRLSVCAPDTILKLKKGFEILQFLLKSLD